jgi:hypothetical protein
MSPKNVANDPNKSILKKGAFKSFWLHWPVYTVDYSTRKLIMTAQMLHDGSFDAHSVNENGELQYDEKKDKRYWNSDGTQTEKQKRMREDTRQDLIGRRYMSETDRNLPRAYTFEEEKVLKDISDQVVYNMGNDGHTNVQNWELGRQFRQFKSFVAGQVEQAISRPYQRLASGHRVEVEDEYGNKVIKFQPEDYEGMIRGSLYAVKQLITIGGSPIERLQSLNPSQRKNLSHLILDVILYGGLMAIYNANNVDEKKKYKFGNRIVSGSRLNESIKASALDLVNPFFPNFWVGSLSKNMLPSVDFAVNSYKMGYDLAHLDWRKAAEDMPLARSDVKILEQVADVKSIQKKHKQLTQ